MTRHGGEDPPAWRALVLWPGLVATGLSYVLFQRGIAGLPAGTVATLSRAEPATATLLEFVVLGEPLSRLSVMGTAVVLLGPLLMTIGAGTQKSRKSHRTRVGTIDAVTVQVGLLVVGDGRRLADSGNDPRVWHTGVLDRFTARDAYLSDLTR